MRAQMPGGWRRKKNGKEMQTLDEGSEGGDRLGSGRARSPRVRQKKSVRSLRVSEDREEAARSEAASSRSRLGRAGSERPEKDNCFCREVTHGREAGSMQVPEGRMRGGNTHHTPTKAVRMLRTMGPGPAGRQANATSSQKMSGKAVTPPPKEHVSEFNLNYLAIL